MLLLRAAYLTTVLFTDLDISQRLYGVYKPWNS